MIDELWLVAGQVAIIAVLGAAGALLFRRSFRLSWFLGALALYVLYDGLLTRGFHLIPNLPASADWNWLGKAMSLTGSLAIAALPAFGYARSGLTLRQKPGWPVALGVLAALSALFFYLAISGADGKPDSAETIAFQWTMPGLDEEVFYRGVLLLAMNEAFRAKVPILGAGIGFGGLLTSVLFGLAHALDYDAKGYSFDAMTFALTGGPSLILLWLRERTGSVLLPIIGHNIANGASTLF